MPYKFEYEKMKIPKEKDKRRKLTDEQKKEIAEKYATGLYSQRQLAKEYNVSRRLIVFVIYPEKLMENRAAHNSSKYYDREKHKEYMKTHRDYKKSLYDDDVLIKKGE